jgi:hypothetical protein
MRLPALSLVLVGGLSGAAPDATYRGAMVAPPSPKPRFVLTDTSGAPFDFWEEPGDRSRSSSSAIATVPTNARGTWPPSESR